MKRRIHVWDLPKNKIYVQFNEDFRKNLFNLAIKEFGSFVKLGKFLNVKRADTTIATNWRNGTNCCPLDLMIKLANKISVPLKELEKNIKEVRYKSNIHKRGGNSGKPIINPKLPIVIDDNFAEILGHICGDGTISRSNIKKGIYLKYINSEPVLIEKFKRLIKETFGKIEPNIQIRGGGNYKRPNYYLQYPSIVSMSVLKVFDYKPKGGMNIPDFIFGMSKKSKARFLRALFDDESCVIAGKGISIGLKPINPLKNIKLLIEELGIKTGNLYSYKIPSGDMWRFSIGKMKSLKRFDKIIGFVHPSKSEKLKYTIYKKRRFERYDNSEPKNKIINLLKDKGELTADEISKELNRSKETIIQHLRNIHKDGLINNLNNQNRSVWYINQQNVA